MLHATSLGSVTVIALAMCWSLAVVLWRVGVRGSVARRLAILLVVEGAALATSGSLESLFGSATYIHARHPLFASIEVLLLGVADCGMLVFTPRSSRWR